MSPIPPVPMSWITRTTCRVCDSPKINPLYSLGDLCISNFIETGEPAPTAPLDIVMCENCSLVQLKHTAPQELLYARYYWYRSGVTGTMRKALQDITEKIERMVALKEGDIVLDIGSNDGTLLRTYATQGLVTVGVEPATNLAGEGRKGLAHFINDFWHIHSYRTVVGSKARVITAIGMFYDMEDPNQFIRDAALALTEDGVFVAQLMCLRDMLESNDVGNICHEHLEFYSLATLEHLFRRNGLELMDVEHNGVNGGSYRVYARLEGGKASPCPGAEGRLEDVRAQEKDLASVRVHLEFFRRVEANKDRCVKFIKGEVARGKRVWVYGASTKGNTILQYYRLDHRLIEGASERSCEKWGKVTVGTHIPIYSEEDARRAQPDYFLVLPYAFFEEFYERESQWRARGGTFIVPIPEFRVVA